MDGVMERRPDVAPHPAGDRDPGGFEVHWAAEPGPIPESVSRDLRELAETVGGVLGEGEGMVGTRFGRRVVVAPANAPDEAVDVADVDPTRSLVLTMGGKDPTPEGALLAKVLRLREDVRVGYARAPEVDGPTMGVLSRLLPALRGATGTHLPGLGRVALGRRPREVAAALEEVQDEDDDRDLDLDDVAQA
jgi:hypothetical protein